MPAYWPPHNVHYILPYVIQCLCKISFVAQHLWGNKKGAKENIIKYSKYFQLATLGFSLVMHEQRNGFVEELIFNFFEHMRRICIQLNVMT
jgi:hypothetical protein